MVTVAFALKASESGLAQFRAVVLQRPVIILDRNLPVLRPFPSREAQRSAELAPSPLCLSLMRPLFDSFWRALAYCLRPRVVVMSLLPLLLTSVLALLLGYFYWQPAVEVVRAWLTGPGFLGTVWGWLQGWGLSHAADYIAPLLVAVLATPVLVLGSLLAVALLMMPALVTLVADQRFAELERRRGASLVASLTWSTGSTALALVLLLVSIPLWFIPPMVLVLPPLIWGWLTYRVMAFDALAEHASKVERKTIFLRHRASLLLMGVVCGFLGAAPAVVWASGVVFAAAFLVLIPVAIWIYTVVFAFSALWFIHFCLAALEQLRAASGTGSEGTMYPAPLPSGLVIDSAPLPALPPG